ncbi:MAG: hypothetical protein ACREA0_26565, partial [bacterium]
IQWMIIRIMEGDYAHRRGADLRPEVQAELDSRAPGLAARLAPLLRPDRYDEARAVLRAAIPTEEDAVGLNARLNEITGWRIGYFLTDNRMLPIDFEETPTIEAGSIFYAPVFLANKNPDDFVQTVYVDNRGLEYAVVAYEMRDNVSRQLAQTRVEDSQGNVWFASQGGLYRSTPDGKRIDYSFNQGNPIPLERIKLSFKAPFYQTMFYKGYVGGEQPSQGNLPVEFLQGVQSAGKDLRHFRLVKNESSVRLLKYYEGAVVEGRVTFAGDGQGLAGLSVETFDEMGIRHDRMLTDQNGTYRVLLPFGAPDEQADLQDVEVRVVSATGALANQTFRITEAAAMRRAPYNHSKDFAIGPGAVSGFTYLDNDRDGEYNATIDELARGVRVSLD